VHLQTEKQYLLDQIKHNADPGLKKVISSVIPTGLRMYALRAPVLREIGREDLLALAEAMWDGKSRDEPTVALGPRRAREQGLV